LTLTYNTGIHRLGSDICCRTQRAKSGWLRQNGLYL